MSAIDELERSLKNVGIVLTDQQRSSMLQKLGVGGDDNHISASPEKFKISEAIEAASSGPAHIREAAKFATGMARRNLISLDCDELG